MMNLQGQTKVCRKCGKEKGLHDFHTRGRGSKKLFVDCKVCRREERILRYARDKDKDNKKCAEYYTANTDWFRARNVNRRAREKAAKGSFTAKEFAAKVKAYDDKCYYCKEPHEGKLHAEHFIPLSKGGSNEIDNIVPACATCNLKKGAKMPWEFKEGETYYPKEPEQWKYGY